MENKNIKINILKNLTEYKILDIFKDELIEEDYIVIENQKEKFENDPFYVAVLGRQGAGKSSLLNALLLNEKIIPVDITETTNVLTKIVRTDESMDYIEVIFNNGTLIKGEFTESFLNEYVNQEFNPNNEKDVKEVICYTSKLKNPGIVFVDTPGVQSLNENNGKVTYDFLPHITTGIFLFTTSPALLDDEMNFLKASWRFTNNYFFVQNIYNESEKNIILAKNKNLEQLKEIANQFEYSKDIKVYDIYVDKALQARCNINDLNSKKAEEAKEMEIQSNILGLEKDIYEHINNDPLKIKISGFLSILLNKIKKLISELLIRRENLLNGEKKTDDEFYENMKIIRINVSEKEAEWNKLKRNFNEDILKLKNDSTDEIENRLDTIENEMNEHIINGKIKSEKIKIVFDEKISRFIDLLVEEYSNKYELRLRQYIKEVEKIQFDQIIRTTLNLGEIDDYDITVNIAEFSQYVGGIGLSFIAGDILIAAIGIGAAEGGLAAAAAAAASVPVWGWIAAGALLVVGGFTKSYYKQKTKIQLQESIQKAIKKVKLKMREEINEKFYNNAIEFSSKIDNSFQLEIKNIYKEQENLERDRKLNKEDQSNKVNEIQNNLNQLHLFVEKANSIEF